MKWTVLADTTTTTPADITTDITAKSSGKQVNNKEPRRIKKRPVKSDNNNINNKQKRQKVGKILSVNDLDDLEWNNIPFCESTPFTEDSAGGYTMLEEIDDVEVIYEKNERGGNTVKFRKLSNNEEEDDNQNEDMKEQSGIDSDAPEDEQQEQVSNFQDNNEQEIEEVNKDLDMSAWEQFGLNVLIIKGLRQLGFSAPTEIQAQVLLPAIEHKRDILGAAETGSGKTLAFALPIVQSLLESNNSSSTAGVKALILTPTRELAIQVKNHIDQLCKYCNQQLGTCAIVGGMSVANQQRHLLRNPQIIIATPGRFWELLSEGEPYLQSIKQTLRFLVIDEADRMIEKGHFKDLGSILNTLNTKPVFNEWIDNGKGDQIPVTAETESNSIQKSKRQTFVFSATLVQKFSTDSKQHQLHKGKGKKDSPQTITDALMEMIQFRDKRPLLVDLTTKQMVARSLTESRIDCLQSEKDVYLYYFLCRYPGRTIVFVNSISCIRRLSPLLALLNVKAYGLHAQMQQRQRLKNLDRFKTEKNCVLIASDVAARGLDIPMVDHVIHYQLPRSVDLYVHRSGRTARSQQQGISVMFCCPEESKSYKEVCKSLGKDKGLPVFPIELLMLNPLRERVKLAVEIDKIEHGARQKKHDDSWMLKVAEEMDLEVDDESLGAPKHQKKDLQRIAGLKQKLQSLLYRPLMPSGTSTRYITGGIVENLPEQLLENLQAESGLKLFPGAPAVDAHKVMTRNK